MTQSARVTGTVLGNEYVPINGGNVPANLSNELDNSYASSNGADPGVLFIEMDDIAGPISGTITVLIRYRNDLGENSVITLYDNLNNLLGEVELDPGDLSGAWGNWEAIFPGISLSDPTGLRVKVSTDVVEEVSGSPDITRVELVAPNVSIVAPGIPSSPANLITTLTTWRVIDLDWENGDETNTEGYLVQRSIDGSDWETISTITDPDDIDYQDVLDQDILIQGSEICYRIIAVNATYGNSEPCVESCETLNFITKTCTSVLEPLEREFNEESSDAEDYTNETT